MGPGLPGRHAQPSSPASQLPAGDSAGPGRVLGPHPHRVHHWGLGPRHQGRQGQLQQPGAQVLSLEVLQEEDELSYNVSLQHQINSRIKRSILSPLYMENSLTGVLGEV